MSGLNSNDPIVIKASQLHSLETQKIFGKVVETNKTEQIIVENDIGLTKQQIYSEYMAALLPGWKKIENTDLEKDWSSRSMNNTDGSKYEMPSLEERRNKEYFEFSDRKQVYQPDTGKTTHIASAKELYEQSDGKIDYVNQGKTGDCWLLTGLLALSNTQEGAKALKDSMKKNPDGSIDLTFNGVDGKPTYKVTQQDLEDINNSKLSGGKDPDPYIWEIGTRKLLKDHPELGYDSEKEPLNAGRAEDFIKWITGKESSTYFSRVVREKTLYRILESTKNNPNILTMTAGSYLLTPDGSSVKSFTKSLGFGPNQIEQEHAYTVLSINHKDNTIVLQDPDDSRKHITLSWKEFAGKFNQLTIVPKVDFQEKSKITIIDPMK